MRNSVLRLVFGVLVLVLGGAAEDLLPQLGGVGAPVLLVAALFMAQRGTLVEWLVFAVAAGAMEDALCDLPTAASVSYFLASAAVVRFVGLPRLVAALAYPGYLIWLWIWTGSIDGAIFTRLLLSVPVGFATALAVGVLCAAAERRAAINEAG